jgi:hypothetical protein
LYGETPGLVKRRRKERPEDFFFWTAGIEAVGVVSVTVLSSAIGVSID